MKIEKPDLFRFLDYRHYLAELYNINKERDRSLSYRFLAEKMGFKSLNYVKLIVDGERNLSSAHLVEVANFLKLSEDEIKYFELLLKFDQSTDIEKKDQIVVQLRDLRPRRKIKEIDGNEINLLDEWYYIPMMELSWTKDFSEDPKWLSQRLGLKTDVAAKAFKQLVKAGFLQQDKKGQWKKNFPVTETPDEVAKYMIQRYHVMNLRFASTKVLQQKVEEREFASMTFTANPKLVKEVKSRIKKFRDEMGELLADTRPDDDEIFQLNFQLFRVTEKISET